MDQTVPEAIIHPGLIALTDAANADDKMLIEDLYLSVLNRLSTDPRADAAAGCRGSSRASSRT